VLTRIWGWGAAEPEFASMDYPAFCDRLVPTVVKRLGDPTGEDIH